MCEGHRRRYWATGLPGWMRGGGRGWSGWGHPWHASEHSVGACACGPEWVGGGPHAFRPWWGEPSAEDELAILKGEAETVKHYLEGIERRMTELEKASAAHGTA